MPDSASTETSRSSRRRSSATTPAKPSRAATRPPTTEVPPPKGTSATRCSDAPGDQRGDLVVRAGHDHGVRGVGAVARAHPQQVRGGLAAGVPDPGLVVEVHVRRPRAGRGSAARWSSVSAGAGQPYGVQRRRGVLGRGPEGELHQAAGGLGEGAGLGRVAPAGPVHLRLRLSVMCYSVTHDVNSSQRPAGTGRDHRAAARRRPRRRSSPSAGSAPRSPTWPAAPASPG